MRALAFLLTPVNALLNAAAHSFSSCNSTWPTGSYAFDTSGVPARRLKR